MKKILLYLIKGYQFFISPLLMNSCRFYPSCSHYAYDAIEQHGVRSGVTLTIKRILKCHPYHPGGCDFVPPLNSKD